MNDTHNNWSHPNSSDTRSPRTGPAGPVARALGGSGSIDSRGTRRESPLGPGAPTEGTITYTQLVEGKFAESRSEGPDKTVYRAVIGYNDQKKMLAVFERL